MFDKKAHIISYCIHDRFSIIIPIGMENLFKETFLKNPNPEENRKYNFGFDNILVQKVGKEKFYHITKTSCVNDILKNGFIVQDRHSPDYESRGNLLDDGVYATKIPYECKDDCSILEIEYNGTYYENIDNIHYPHLTGECLLSPLFITDVKEFKWGEMIEVKNNSFRS